MHLPHPFVGLWFGSGCVPLPRATAPTGSDPLPPLQLLSASGTATPLCSYGLEMVIASGYWSF